MGLRIIFIVLSAMLSACATSVKNIKPGDEINKEHGIFLTKLRTNHPFNLAVKDLSGNTIWLNKNRLKNNKNLLAASLPAGKYSIHSISWKDKVMTFEEDNRYKFKIKNAKVNYICDFGVYFKIKDASVNNIEFVLPFYSKQTTFKEFNKNYPEIAKKYAFTSSPVSNCVRGESENAQQLLRLLK